MYFDEDVQNAIVQYNTEENHVIRNKIYSERIAYALDKLCENIINTFKFSYFDAHFNDVKQEVLSFLVLNMHKYNHEKGFKAFSYFSVVAKNYLILTNNNNYKKLKTHNSSTKSRELTNLSVDKLKISNENERSVDFLNLIILYFDDKIPKLFKKRDDISIAHAVIKLFKERYTLENFNKKGLYLLIREMTGVETSKITKVINVMKKHYIKMQKEFNVKGHVTM